MAGVSAGQGGITGGAAAPSQAGLSSGITFGGNAGIGVNPKRTLSPVQILLIIAAMLIALLFVIRSTK